MNNSSHPGDELLSAHIDGALSVPEAAELARHLTSCTGCAGRLEMLRATSLAVSGLPEVVPPRPVDLGFLAAARVTARTPVESPRQKSRGSRLSRLLDRQPPHWAFAGAGAVAGLLVALSFTGLLVQRNAMGTTSSQLSGSGGLQPAPVTDLAPSGDGNAPLQAGGLAVPGTATAGRAAAPTVHVPALGLTLTLSGSAAPAAMGSPVPIRVSVVGDPGGGRLSGGRVELFLRSGNREEFLGGTTGTDTLAGGERRDFVYTWTAGSLPGRATPAPGSYQLLARVYDGSQAFDLPLAVEVR